MRRRYDIAQYRDAAHRLRARLGDDLAITTDVIVGFPGETDDDFAQTLEVVAEARFASAFTFQYSKRPGTPAADLDGQVPKEVVQERYERLVALQDDVSWSENKRQVGRDLDVLVAEGEGRKDGATHRLSGRARDNRLVHVAFDAAADPADLPRPGDVVTARVTYAAPHHLLADVGRLDDVRPGAPAVRRTRAGDAWAARNGAAAAPAGVLLGMPTVGAPAREPAGSGGCS